MSGEKTPYIQHARRHNPGGSDPLDIQIPHFMYYAIADATTLITDPVAFGDNGGDSDSFSWDDFNIGGTFRTNNTDMFSLTLDGSSAPFRIAIPGDGAIYQAMVKTGPVPAPDTELIPFNWYVTVTTWEDIGAGPAFVEDVVGNTPSFHSTSAEFDHRHRAEALWFKAPSAASAWVGARVYHDSTDTQFFARPPLAIFRVSQ